MAERKTIIRKFLTSVAIPTLFGTLIILFSLSTCKKFEPEGFLFITTDTTQALGGGNYKLNGSVVKIGADQITQHGFCWSEQRNPTTTGSSSQLGSRTTTGDFSSTISGLSPTTTYYYRAYVTTTAGTEYALEKSFTTEASLPTVITSAVGNVTSTSAQGGGNVTDNGGANVTARGSCWSTSQNPTISDSNTTDGSGSGSYTSALAGLICGTTYYIRAYATNSSGTSYGNQEQFTTSECTVVQPTVTTASVTSITEITALGGGNVTDDGGATVTANGICWSTSQDPTIADSKTTDGSGVGIFESELSGLSCGTSYFVRAYATNSAGTSYGNQVEFSTNQCTANPPAVTTLTISSVTETSAQGGGNVTDDGGVTVTEKGICWSISSNPTISDSITTDGSGTGSYTSALTGLSCGTTYYVRAYASNSSGTSYGDQKVFSTNDCPVDPPTVTTLEISGITETSAQGGGNVTDDGGANVTARGICWSTSQNPTTSDRKTTDGSDAGSFTSAMDGLTCGTTYFVRAYATNSSGTSYGNQEQFTTSQCPVDPPTVTTSKISGITETSAQGGGNVTDDGGATVTAKGICWSTSQNPTTSDVITTDGSGTGSYTSALVGLTCGTTYFVRAYATNSAGTSYGNQEQFTTSQCAVPPTVSTYEISNISGNSAQGGGNVTSDGGATVTVKGLCWSTSTNPTTSDYTSDDGTGIGTFSSDLTGLSPLTTYYVRAYAINSAGTSYGNQVNFATVWDNSTITDFDGNVYNTVQIGDQVWMAENLKVTHYSDGELLQFIEDEPDWDITGPTDRAYCWFDYNESNRHTYGALYSWAAAMHGENSSDLNPSGIQGVCPVGWHIPSDAEWKEMEIYLGMNPTVADGINWRGTDEGGKLKSMDPLWIAPNVDASNDSEFSALPGGYIQQNGMSVHLGYWAVFWTSTAYSGGEAWHRNLLNNYAQVYRYFYDMRGGFSIRCIRD